MRHLAINRVALMALFVAVLSGLLVVGPAATVRASSAGLSRTASCDVRNFDRTSGLEAGAGAGAGAGFAHADCAGGWAIAAGARGPAGGTALFHVKAGRWVEISQHGLNEPSGTPRATPLEYAAVGTGIPSSLLQDLARPFDLVIRRNANAGALVEQLARHESSLGAAGAYQASSVIDTGKASWLVLEGADVPEFGGNSSVTALPYPYGRVQIFRWLKDHWALQGLVTGWFGPIGGCCEVAAEHLTGARAPDFALTAGGAADTVWTAIVSDVGGHWHQIPFDYGYTDSPVVNAYAIKDRGILTAVDACGCASGPTTELFERYRDGVFRPAPLPGAEPSCSIFALRAAVGYPDRRAPDFSKFDCADGWALALEPGSGSSPQTVGLLVATGAKWRLMKLNAGEDLGSDPWTYDIPLSLVTQLASRLGPTLVPAVATGKLVAEPIMIGPEFTGDVISAMGAQWFVAEKATGSQEAPGADALIYRWSGSDWVKEGEVDQLPISLNYFQALAGLTFTTVSVAGSNDPGFTVAQTPGAAVLTDVGGRWQVAG